MAIKGECGKETSNKQSDFRAIMLHHINICNRIEKRLKNNNPYIYGDAFAGQGYYKDEHYTGPGSPLIVKELIDNHLEFNHIRYIYEENPTNYRRLIKYIGKENVFNMSCRDLLTNQLPIEHRWQFGMFYFDPPMTEDTFWLSSRIMKKLSDLYQQLDLMFYVSCGTIKRIGGTGKNISLDELIKDVDKQWIIRDLRSDYGKQYTFLIGTNWKGWATWKIKGFHPIDSPQGKIIFNKANNGNVKKKKYKQTSFLTGLMENTYNIPDIELLDSKRLIGLKAFVNFVRQGK